MFNLIFMSNKIHRTISFISYQGVFCVELAVYSSEVEDSIFFQGNYVDYFDFF